MRLAWALNSFVGWKYSSSFQWTAICASVGSFALAALDREGREFGFVLGTRILRGEILAAVRGERESAKVKSAGSHAAWLGQGWSLAVRRCYDLAVEPESCIARILLTGRSLTPTSSLDRVESGARIREICKILVALR